MIQAIYKGIEIEMELHQRTQGYWKCVCTLIKHPKRTRTLHYGDKEFPSMDLARDYALQEATPTPPLAADRAPDPGSGPAPSRLPTEPSAGL